MPAEHSRLRTLVDGAIVVTLALTALAVTELARAVVRGVGRLFEDEPEPEVFDHE